MIFDDVMPLARRDQHRDERELDDELQFHLQMKRRELESQGLDHAAADDLAQRFRTALA